MPAWEATQYALGLMLPALLVVHVVGTRIAWWRLGVDDPYTRIVLALWVQAPEYGARQTLTLVLAWLHACIGVHFWLRFRPWYPARAPWLFAVALLLPTLALLGFVAAGREVSALARSPGWTEAMLRAAHAPTPRRGRTAGGDPSELPDRLPAGRCWRSCWRAASAGCRSGGARCGSRTRRVAWWRCRSDSRSSTPAGRPISRTPRCAAGAGAARPAACESRADWRSCRRPARPSGACSRASAPRPTSGWPARPGRPRDVTVEPLLAPSVAPADAFATDVRQGHEQELAVLFADLRGFTRMAEHKLPYDVVFFLNRYFEAVGTAITSAGGVTNQFTGDGVMALFGIETGPATGSRQALAAARAMVEGRGRAERRAGRRSAGADAHRHRHSRRPRGGRTHGLGRELLPHGGRRHRARRRAAGAGDQGLPRGAGRVRGGRPLRRRSICQPSRGTTWRCTTARGGWACGSSRRSPTFRFLS